MKHRAIIAGFAMLLTVLSAFAIAVPAAAAAAEEDVLYIAMQQDLPDFNNYNVGTNSVWKANVIGYAYEGLSGTDYDLGTFKLLAEDWTFDEENLIVDVDIRQGVTFHDGETMDADDVMFSYYMARNGTTYADRIVLAFDEDEDGVVSDAEFDAGLQKTGDYSVRFTMARPYGQFFASTLSVPIMPEHIWNDDDLDFTDDQDQVIVSKSDELMAIGTGPWYYDGGVANSYRVMRAYEDYWGKDFMTPADMPTYPRVVDTLYYKIYTSIDTAILALQGGDVDYIAWAITAGRVPSLQSDPNIELQYMSDSGYFYLAFNMKKEPMNNLTFRKAVSHLIDKDQIVDVYMGGFGQAGSAAVPPFFGEWYNPAVTKYPFDLDVANDLLDDAGYIDANGDGWRDMPDGSLMDKITLMTPPADYDPIRIKAGQMLATNMRAAGINVEAKPIDFNTLVAKLTAFDYQMLELGWRFTGYTECVSVLFDIYGPLQASNSWAFWTEEHENPYYASLGGVSTLADQATLDYANAFYDIEQDARATFIQSEQIDFVKQGQEIIADAIPCNVLYYRVNVEAHNKIWTNWTVFDGTLINAFGFNVLEYSEAGGASGGGAVTTSISAGLTLPGKVRSTESVEATVLAMDSAGKLVSGAAVAVNVTGGGVMASPMSGTTDENGVFTFDVTGTALGESTVKVDVTSGTSTDSDSANIRTYPVGGLGVVVTPEKVSVVAGETIDVECYVADANGPVEGADVLIDKYLLGYGTVDPEVGTTDADGMAVLSYIAPEADLMNQHMLVTISASVAKDGYLYTNVGSAGVVVYNDAVPEWMIVSVDDVTTTALSPTSPDATITVMLTDAAGDPIGSETLDVRYSDEAMVDSPVTEVTTAADGTADVDVSMADTGASGALRVTIGKFTAANSISDTVTFTYVDPADPAPDMWGGYVQYGDTKFIEALGTLDVTIHVFDSNGDPAADGTAASVFVAATDYGQLADWSGSEYNTLWDYAGMNILTEADGQNIVSAGSFAIDYEDWGFYGVELAGGVYEMTLEGIDLAHLDLAMGVYLCPNATGTYSFDTWNYEIHGQTTISSMYGYGRSMAFTGARYFIADPVLQAKTSDFETTTIDVWVYDESNDPVEGALAWAYEGAWNPDYGLEPYTDGVPDMLDTDADGYATWDIVCAAWNDETAAYDLVPGVTVPNLFVAGYVDGTISLLSQTQLVIEPIVSVAFAAFEPVLTPQPLGFPASVTATVVDLNGDPIPDLPVIIGVSGGMAYDTETVTDENGMVMVAVDTSEVSDVAAAFVAVELETSGSYEASTARVMLAVVNEAPVISLGVPAEDEEVVGPDANLVGSVFDMNGLAAVTMQLDSASAVDILDEEGMTSQMIEQVLAALDEGEHTVTVTATDSLGQESEVSVTFTIVAEEDAGTDMIPWVVAAVGWIVAAVVLVMMFMKMKKPASAAPAPETVEEPEEPEVEKPE